MLLKCCSCHPPVACIIIYKCIMTNVFLPASLLQHFSLGKKAAFEVASKAYELRKEVLGEVHALIASCLFAMAVSLKDQYK